MRETAKRFAALPRFKQFLIAILATGASFWLGEVFSALDAGVLSFASQAVSVLFSLIGINLLVVTVTEAVVGIFRKPRSVLSIPTRRMLDLTASATALYMAESLLTCKNLTWGVITVLSRVAGVVLLAVSLAIFVSAAINILYRANKEIDIREA